MSPIVPRMPVHVDDAGPCGYVTRKLHRKREKKKNLREKENARHKLTRRPRRPPRSGSSFGQEVCQPWLEALACYGQSS